MFNVDLPAVPPSSPLNLPKGPLALGQVEAIRQGAHFKGTGRLWKMSEKCVSAICLFPCLSSPASSLPAPESPGERRGFVLKLLPPTKINGTASTEQRGTRDVV